MKVSPIDQRYFDRRAPECLSGTQAAEAAAQNHHAMPLSHFG